MHIQFVIVSLITAISAAVMAPIARADDSVTYEVISDSIGAATIEYFDRSARRMVEDAPLPWRLDATVVNAHSPSTDGAEVRADWRPNRRVAGSPSGLTGMWVTVRISFRGKVLCENTLDIGDAACYGSTSFRS